MDNETQKIINFIQESESNSNFTQIFNFQKNEALYFKAMIFSGCSTLFLSVLPIPSLIFLITATIFILCSILYITSEFLSLKKSISSPLTEYFETFDKRNSEKDEYIRQLSIFSLEGINYVKEVLQKDSIKLQKRSAFLIGSIEKVGLFPALLALFIASLKFIDTSNANFTYPFLALVVGLYIGAFLLQRLISKLETQIEYLEIAASLKNK